MAASTGGKAGRSVAALRDRSSSAIPLLRRSATAPLCGFGRTAPLPGGAQAQPGRTQRRAWMRTAGQALRRARALQTVMEARQHHHGTRRRHRGNAARVGPGCLAARVARRSQASTLVLVRQWPVDTGWCRGPGAVPSVSPAPIHPTGALEHPDADADWLPRRLSTEASTAPEGALVPLR